MKVALRLADAYRREKERNNLASSRIRGHFLAKYWPECDDNFYPSEFDVKDFFSTKTQLDILSGYDTIILNKTYEPELAEELVRRHKKVILDICDPDFLKGYASERRVRDCCATMRYADVIVVNGKELKKAIEAKTDKPVFIIPDRLDLDWHKPKKKEHSKELKSLVWYGYSHNLRTLEPYMKELVEKDYKLTIISDKFFENLFLPTNKDVEDKIRFVNWQLETVNEEIIKHDCVFTARDRTWYSKFKSNNRTITAWALKMPATSTIKGIEYLNGKVSRKKASKRGWKEVKEGFDIRQSVKQYKDIISKL